MGDSLIMQGKKQLELLSSADMPDALFEEQERALAGEFTGERLFAREPEKYRLVVSLSAEGMGAIKIGKLLGVSPNTVLAVRSREGRAVDIEKKELAGRLYGAAGLAVEALIDDLSDKTKRDRIPARDKALITAIAVDKAQLLAGEATARLEVQEMRAPEHDDFNRYLAGLKDAAVATRGSGETAGQKGAVVDLEPATAAAVPSGQTVGPGGGSADVQSDGKAKDDQ